MLRLPRDLRPPTSQELALRKFDFIERTLQDGIRRPFRAHIFCRDAPLARLEMQVALDERLARTQRFEFANDAARRAAYPSNNLASLPLRVL